VQDAVLQEATKKDNRRKLIASGSPERHLFVYVDPNRYPAWVGLMDEQPPLAAPQLPEEVTHVWAVTSARTSRRFVVWRFIPTKGWRNEGSLHVDVECDEH
jgi:hypothetical protein